MCAIAPITAARRPYVWPLLVLLHVCKSLTTLKVLESRGCRWHRLNSQCCHVSTCSRSPWTTTAIKPIFKVEARSICCKGKCKSPYYLPEPVRALTHPQVLETVISLLSQTRLLRSTLHSRRHVRYYKSVLMDSQPLMCLVSCCVMYCLTSAAL